MSKKISKEERRKTMEEQREKRWETGDGKERITTPRKRERNADVKQARRKREETGNRKTESGG